MGSVRGAGGEEEEVMVYVKAGVDGERVGACPFCQRVLMVLLLKAQDNLLRFKVHPTNPSKPPVEFKTLGLKHVPALIHGDDGHDNPDDILRYLDTRFPGGGVLYDCVPAEVVTKDFFSRFCFYVKAVNQDPTKLEQALQRLDHFLQTNYKGTSQGVNSDYDDLDYPPGQTRSRGPDMAIRTIKEEPEDEIDFDDPPPLRRYLVTDHLTHLDCEVLPKLQHLRVAAMALKGYHIPTHLKGIWRYLHEAYTNPVFVETCPCDQEIILHWHDRPETPSLSHKKHATIAKEKPKYSFDVPVHASRVTVIDSEGSEGSEGTTEDLGSEVACEAE